MWTDRLYNVMVTKLVRFHNNQTKNVSLISFLPGEKRNLKQTIIDIWRHQVLNMNDNALWKHSQNITVASHLLK